MTPETIATVRASFATLAPVAPTMAEVFYENLFRRAPAMRTLFQEDMTVQRGRLIDAIAAALAGLDDPDALAPVLRAMGQRHRAYGASEGDYFSVGAALVDTLADALGEDWTDEVAEAWTRFYVFVARAMKDGAREETILAA